jgi:hypothetical protein
MLIACPLNCLILGGVHVLLRKSDLMNFNNTRLESTDIYQDRP